MLDQKARALVWHEFLNSVNKMETCEKEINALAYPVFSTDKTKPANIVIPISEKIHRTIQSSLNDSSAWCGVKLPDSYDDPPVRIRFQIEYSSRVPFSVVKRILAVCKTTIQVGFLTIQKQFHLFFQGWKGSSASSKHGKCNLSIPATYKFQLVLLLASCSWDVYWERFN